MYKSFANLAKFQYISDIKIIFTMKMRENLKCRLDVATCPISFFLTVQSERKTANT